MKTTGEEPSRCKDWSGLTRVEILVVLFLIFVLSAIAWPFVMRGIVIQRSGLTAAIVQMRQLHAAAEAMTLDNGKDANPVRWTCSNGIPLTYANWINLIVDGKYLSSKEMHDLMRLPQGGSVGDSVGIATFAVDESDPAGTLLFATKNWHGPGVELSGEPYGTNGFVIFRKGGEGRVLRGSSATNGTVVGAGGKYGFQELR